MSCITWATHAVEDSRRFEYYRDGLCASYARLTPHKTATDLPLDVCLRLWAHDDKSFSQLSSTSHLLSRTAKDIRTAEDDHLYLNFVATGEMYFEQSGIRHRLTSGQFVLVDNARPFEADLRNINGHTHLACRMPRNRISIDLSEATQRLSRHKLTPLLVRLFDHANESDDDWAEDDMLGTFEAIDGLTRVILSGPDSLLDQSRAMVTRKKVEQEIRIHSHEATLDITVIADAVGIPVRTVQQHLMLCGTNFRRLLSQARCDAALALLRRDGQMSLEEIAFAVGFLETSSFYRAFKRHFGATPRSLRN